MSNPVLTQVYAEVTSIPFAYGYQTSPPIAYQIVAEKFNDEAGSSVDGRFHSHSGTIESNDSVLRQDTYQNGTASRAGRPFSVVAGTWRSDWKSPYYDTFGMLLPDSTPGVTFDLLAASTTTTIETAEVWIGRGFPGVGDSTVYSSSNTYCYLELCAGQQYNYRVALEYGKAIRLDFSNDSSVTWNPVMVANGVLADKYLTAHADTVKIRIRPNAMTGELFVEIGNDAVLHHGGSKGITLTGKIRLNGKNGSCSFSYFPLRHKDVKITKAPAFLTPKPHGNAANARIVFNSLTPTSDNQYTSYQYQSDGQTFQYQVNATLPDAGEGQGSAEPSRLSDATLLVDEVWSYQIDGDFSAPVVSSLRVIDTQILQVWDDNARALITSGRLILNNYDNRYYGAFGNFAVAIRGQIGDCFGNAFPPTSLTYGICGAGEEGIGFYDAREVKLISLPFTDKRTMMQVALNTEIIFDGWCLFSAVRWIARAGNIHPNFLTYIPYYPDGPAGADCPYPILARGTGNNPRYRYTPQWLCWDVLLSFVQDSGYPVSLGLSIPYYTGFDSIGNLRFEVYDPLANAPLVVYDDTAVGVSADGSILPLVGALEVSNSTAQLRSEINFQGLDGITFELLQYHRETSLAVRQAIGYRDPWLERNARYGSRESLTAIGDTGVSVASLPSQVVTFESVYAPWVQAGQSILISSSVQGLGEFVITSINSHVGSDTTGRNGRRRATSTLQARSINSYPTANGVLF